MALTKEEMQDLIERNRLEKQATRAQDEMAVRNRAGERWLNREQAANAAAADRISEARQRRIDRNRLIADGDRGRFSAFETRGLLGLTHTQFGDVRDDTIYGRNALQQHELDMLNQEGQNKIGVAHENALGMRGQGGVAAWIKAGVERDMGRAQHGYFDENGNYVPGSTVHAAQATGMSRTELENIRGQNRMDQIKAQEQGRDFRQQQQIEAGREKTDAWRREKGLDRKANKDNADARAKGIQDRRAQQDAMREQRDFEAFDKNVGNILNDQLTDEQKKEYQKLDAKDRMLWWKKFVGRGSEQKNERPKEGDRKQFMQGWATFRNGKWVPDAQ